MYIIATIAQLIDALLGIVIWVVLAQVIVSWLIAFGVLNTRNHLAYSLVDILDRLTRPVLRPIRRIIPPIGGLDLSPLVVLLLIEYVIRPLLFHYVTLPALMESR